MLTVGQVHHYEEHGYVTVPGVFTEADLAPINAYLQENADAVWTDKNDDPLREAHYKHRPLFDLCINPRLLDRVEQLLGPNLVLLYSHFLRVCTESEFYQVRQFQKSVR